MARRSVQIQHYFSESAGYGYQSWWTYPLDGVYYSAGLYGQRIYVIPDYDIVVVFTTSMNITDPEEWLYHMVTDYIIAACE
jgi:CubicO group peptidase (beta-lactamase class C family)